MAFEETKQVSPSYYLEQFTAGRSTLLGVIVMSIINIVMLLLDTGSYFLFSASIPYYLTVFGILFDSYTTGSVFTVTAIVISAVILTVYFLCWLLSKKRPGWLTAALVLFILDSVALVFITFVMLENPASNLMDLLIHGLVIFQLVRGVLAAKKVRAMEPEAPVTPEGYQGTTPDLD